MSSASFGKSTEEQVIFSQVNQDRVAVSVSETYFYSGENVSIISCDRLSSALLLPQVVLGNKNRDGETWTISMSDTRFSVDYAKRQV